MPRSLDPQTPLELVLDCDAEDAAPATFLARTMTARQWLVYAQQYDQLFEADTSTQQTQHALAMLEQYLVGWRNIDAEFAPGAIGDWLEAGELLELLGKLYLRSKLSYDDKKKFASQRSSNSDSSARAATESASPPPAP